jgi:hypothetical protein
MYCYFIKLLCYLYSYHLQDNIHSCFCFNKLGFMKSYIQGRKKSSMNYELVFVSKLEPTSSLFINIWTLHFADEVECTYVSRHLLCIFWSVLFFSLCRRIRAWRKWGNVTDTASDFTSIYTSSLRDQSYQWTSLHTSNSARQYVRMRRVHQQRGG